MPKEILEKLVFNEFERRAHAVIEFQRNITGKVKKIEGTHLHYQVFEAQEAWKCWPGPLGLKMLTGPRFWGREAKKCWQYHGFGAAGPKKKLTVARFVAFDVQNADCNKVWRLRRLKTLTVLVFGGVGTQNCWQYQGHQRTTEGTQRKQLSSKGLRDNIQGKWGNPTKGL